MICSSVSVRAELREARSDAGGETWEVAGWLSSASGSEGGGEARARASCRDSSASRSLKASRSASSSACKARYLALDAAEVADPREVRLRPDPREVRLRVSSACTWGGGIRPSQGISRGSVSARGGASWSACRPGRWGCGAASARGSPVGLSEATIRESSSRGRLGTATMAVEGATETWESTADNLSEGGEDTTSSG